MGFKALSQEPTVSHTECSGADFQQEISLGVETYDTEVRDSDYDHASTLYRLWRGQWRWWTEQAKWMRWDSRVWQVASDEEATKAASEALVREYQQQQFIAPSDDGMEKVYKKIKSYSNVQGALKFLKGFSGILTKAEDWDSDPWLINLHNGMLELRRLDTGSIDDLQLMRHDAEKLCTKIMPIHFYPEQAECPEFMRHLRYFQPSKEIQREIQRQMGLALLGRPRTAILPIWHGSGANGKTTTIRLFQRLFGNYAIQTAPNLLTQHRHQQHPTEIADLFGSRLAVSSETSAGSVLDEAKVKLLTGGDEQKARFMKKDFFSFAQTWSLVLLCNHVPRIKGSDHGIWRRVRIIPWRFAMPLEEQEDMEKVISRLFAEGSAILNWMLAGLSDALLDPSWTAKEVQVNTSAFRHQMDTVKRFLENRCVLRTGLKVQVVNMYHEYLTWCVAEGEEPLSKRKLGEHLRQIGLDTDRGAKGSHYWKGVNLTQA